MCKPLPASTYTFVCAWAFSRGRGAFDRYFCATRITPHPQPTPPHNPTTLIQPTHAGYWSAETCEALRARMDALVAGFDLKAHTSVFSTSEQKCGL